MSHLENLEPKEVFTFFEQISKIPRGSGNEKEISDYLVEFAKKRGLDYIQDHAKNVLIRKPGTKGYENSTPVILQGHIDMVCEKNNHTVHDFLVDPLKLKVDGDFVCAEGTTLGGDDGIETAYALAILDSNSLSHPPIEAVFTTDEEVGMHGAASFDTSVLKGKTLLNIDTTEEGVFVVSCCGGVKATLSICAHRQKADTNKIALTLQVKGLKGGHSGAEIHRQRPNAIKLLGRILFEIKKTIPFDLALVNGGLMDNAIAREAEAVILIEKKDQENLNKCLSQLEKTFIHEYRGSDTGILLSADPLQEEVFSVLTEEVKQKTISILMLIPYGVRTVNIEMEGEKLIESSSNIGILRTTEDSISFTSAIRSSVLSKKQNILDEITMLAELTGGTISLKGEYPAWEYKPGSRVLELSEKIYENMTGKKPTTLSIHAGLECGIFSGKIEGLDLISFGPNLYDAHTPEERLSISSTKRVWEFIKKVLIELK